jgi:hypothetical protein
MMARCEDGGMKKRALEEGWGKEEDFKRMGEGWKRWIESENGWFACLHGELLAFL